MSVIITIVAVIVFFMILIVPHELGHFTAAKLLGVGVDEFAVGMGPKIFSRQGKETLYSFRTFPIGGFCRLVGEDEDSEDPKSFSAKPAWKKLVILVAGVVMNLLTAYVISLIVFLCYGKGINAVPLAARSVYAMITLILGAFYDLISNGFSLSDVAGPVGVVGAVNETISGSAAEFFSFTAIMCVNLAIFNILPLPALDGGRVLFVLIRKFSGGVISDRAEMIVHGIGMMLLILLMVVITFHDVIRLI